MNCFGGMQTVLMRWLTKRLTKTADRWSRYNIRKYVQTIYIHININILDR